jgi:hypothetical protein
VSNPEEEQQLWNDWEWVLNKTEEITVMQSNDKAHKIKQELKQLRQTAQALKFRPFYMKVAKLSFHNLGHQELIDLSTPLDSSKRSKIVTDVVNSLEDEWLNFVHGAFFLESADNWTQFKSSYKERPYEKNVVGSMKELAFAAFHGPKDTGLHERLLSEILWCIWKTLTGAVRLTLNRDLEESELLLSAKEVEKATEPLVKLYVETVRNSRLGSSKEGKVVQKWKIEQEEEEHRLSKMIEERGIDARYREQLPPERIQCSRDIKELKNILETKLSFSTL